MTSDSHPAYRADIDGLRAIAVVSVVAFHAFPSAVSGGFVGVDIFFVISGFLISSIILKSLDSGVFKFWGFYLRRVRRLFPALLVVLATCFAFGWYVLLADEFEVLGEHVAASALFLQNVLLWDEVDYFDTSAELKPLLHVWSLSVEEQFYLLWPLVLFLAWRFRMALPGLVWTIFGLSFFVNIITVEQHPAAAFYLPFARFWQLLSGSLLAYYTLRWRDPVFARELHPRLRILRQKLDSAGQVLAGRLIDIQSVVGAALIFIAAFGIDRGQPFPGWLALLPVSGALLLISAGPGAWFNHRVLARPGMVFVGLISYPLYLWHWPLLSFARILEMTDPKIITTLVLVSFLLAWLTYRYIETPIRKQKADPVRMVNTAWWLVGGLTVMMVAGLATWKSVIPGRLSAVSREIALARDDWDYPGDGVVGDAGVGTILFFGDSYMRQYRPRMEKLSRSTPWSEKTLLFKTEGGCAPLTGIDRPGVACNEWAAEGDQLADRQDVEVIVLAASWASALNRGDYYRADDPGRTPIDLYSPENSWVYTLLEERIRKWTRQNKRVYIVLAHPAGVEADPAAMIANRLAREPALTDKPLFLADHRKSTAFIHARLQKIAADTGARIIDPAASLCSNDACATRTESGTPIYMDASHLRGSYVRDKVHYLDEIVVD